MSQVREQWGTYSLATHIIPLYINPIRLYLSDNAVPGSSVVGIRTTDTEIAPCKGWTDSRLFEFELCSCVYVPC